MISTISFLLKLPVVNYKQHVIAYFINLNLLKSLKTLQDLKPRDVVQHAGIKRRNTERSHLNNCLFTHYVSRRSNKEPRRKQVRQQRSLVSLKCISACETREKLCYFSSISMINGGKNGSVMSFHVYAAFWTAFAEMKFFKMMGF